MRGSHFTLDAGVSKDQQLGIANFLPDQGKNEHAGGSGVVGQGTAPACERGLPECSRCNPM